MAKAQKTEAFTISLSEEEAEALRLKLQKVLEDSRIVDKEGMLLIRLNIATSGFIEKLLITL